MNTNATVELYTKSWCPFCQRAKALLDDKGVTYIDYDITSDAAGEAAMRQRSGGYTVPQIFINGQLIGGSDDLHALEARGILDELLAHEVEETA